MNTQKIRSSLYGIMLCFLLALPAHFLGKTFPVIGAPIIAIFIGMLLMKPIQSQPLFKAGIQFTSKKLLKLAIILLGFRLSLNQVFASGKMSLPIILSTIFTSLIIAYCLTRYLKLDRKIGILIGVGSSICGGSAIAATAPVINADDEEIAQSISVIFLFNVIAAIIFPTLGGALNMSNLGFGIFAGTAINDTSSVTAAASAWDSIHHAATLETATVVKLTRTLAIIPITLFLSLYESRKKGDQQTLNLLKLVPTFIVLFLGASLITTFIQLPSEVLSYAKTTSKFLITMAMAAIGLGTDVVKLIKTGGKAITVGFACWVSITLVSILMQIVLHLL